MAKTRATGSDSPDRRASAGRAGTKPASGDVLLADMFLADHAGEVRFVAETERWHVWTGTHWAEDRTGAVLQLAVRTARDMVVRAAAAGTGSERRALADQAEKACGYMRLRAALSIARTDPRVVVTQDRLDADPWALNTPTGTVDLRDGSVRPHARGDLITRCTPAGYDPVAVAPTWRRFLREVLPEKPVRRFVQTATGYSATGLVRERVLFFLFGPRGHNGKSTMLNVVRAALGPYAQQAPVSVLMGTPSSGPSSHIARLRGTRHVCVAESSRGAKLDEAVAKYLTGRDTIVARFLYSEFAEFQPTFKLWLATNHAPTVQDQDDAIWGRVRLVHFPRTFTGQADDTDLEPALRTELPGVLAWIVMGAVRWFREGLDTPVSVLAATARYRAEQDPVLAFLADECRVHPDAKVGKTLLWRRYRDWSGETGRPRLGSREFWRRVDALARSAAMPAVVSSSRGHGGAMVYTGLGLGPGRSVVSAHPGAQEVEDGDGTGG